MLAKLRVIGCNMDILIAIRYTFRLLWWKWPIKLIENSSIVLSNYQRVYTQYIYIYYTHSIYI